MSDKGWGHPDDANEAGTNHEGPGDLAKECGFI